MLFVLGWLRLRLRGQGFEFNLFFSACGRLDRISFSGIGSRIRLSAFGLLLGKIDGLAVGVKLLDIGFLAPLGDHLIIKLAADFLLQIRLGRIKVGSRALTLILDLDDMKAEIGLNRFLGIGTGLSLKRGLGEFRHDFGIGKVPKIASVLSRTVQEFSLASLAKSAPPSNSLTSA